MVFLGTFKLIIKNDIKNTGLRFIFVVQTNSIISRKELEYISTFVQDWSLCCTLIQMYSTSTEKTLEFKI